MGTKVNEWSKINGAVRAANHITEALAYWFLLKVASFTNNRMFGSKDIEYINTNLINIKHRLSDESIVDKGAGFGVIYLNSNRDDDDSISTKNMIMDYVTYITDRESNNKVYTEDSTEQDEGSTLIDMMANGYIMLSPVDNDGVLLVFGNSNIEHRYKAYIAAAQMEVVHG